MWPLLVMYVLLIPCVTMFIRIKRTENKGLSVLLKAICISIVVVTGAIGLSDVPEATRLTAVLIVAGLIFGMMGDMAICFTVKKGMLFFGLGHCFYIAALWRLSTHGLAAIPIFVVLYVLVIVLYRISRLSPGKLLLPGLMYAAMLVAMLSTAATLPFSLMPAGAVLCVGAVLFVASDSMLAWIMFHENAALPEENVMNSKYKTLDAVCLWCYFLGQSLFATGVFLLR